MASRRVRITDVSQLPVVMTVHDWAALLQKSEKTVERLERAGQLPPRLVNETADPKRKYRARGIWSKASAIAWLEGGSRRGRRR